MQILVLLVAFAAIALMGTAMTTIAQERYIEENELEAMEMHLTTLKEDFFRAVANSYNLSISTNERRYWSEEVDRLLGEVTELEALMRETEALRWEEYESQIEPPEHTLADKYGIGQGGVTYESNNPRIQEEQRKREDSSKKAIADMRRAQREWEQYEANKAAQAAANAKEVNYEASHVWYGMLASANAAGCRFPTPIANILSQYGNYGKPVPAMLDNAAIAEKKVGMDELLNSPDLRAVLSGHPNEYELKCATRMNFGIMAVAMTGKGHIAGTSFNEGGLINLQGLMNRWTHQLERRY